MHVRLTGHKRKKQNKKGPRSDVLSILQKKNKKTNMKDMNIIIIEWNIFLLSF